MGMCYSMSLHLIPRKYSHSDIMNFSGLLTQYEEHEIFGYVAGIFLSALSQNSIEENVIFLTGNLKLRDSLFALGYRNNNVNITIYGDAGEYLGLKMTSGLIKVIGNASHNVGAEMSGGSIIVKGNIGVSGGYDMRGGSLIVYKDAGVFVGNHMEGGEIHLHRDYGDIFDTNMKGGKVYHKGKLIVKGGKKEV
jgi:formylmethanofuran dehydrogenase subunit C